MTSKDIIDRLVSLEPKLEGIERKAVGEAVELLSSMGEQMSALKQLVAAKYRPSSEKVDPGQLTLDLLGMVARQATSNTSDENVEEVPDRPRPKRKKRRSGVKLLPIDKVNKTLSDEEKKCGCGETMDVIGVDVSRQVVYTPSTLRMLEEHLEKCACRSCKEGMNTASATPKPIEGGLASSSLLAHIAVSKTIDAMPVERLGRKFERQGADFASSTLHDWFGFVGEQAQLIEGVAHEQLLQSQIISLDDTRLLSKQAEDRDGTQRGRLWMYLGDVSRVGLCRFTPDWKGSHPQEVLKGFEGTVQLDGYGGLDPLFRASDKLNRVGCNDHCRRHFVNACKEGDKRAAPVVDTYRRIYEVEARARDMELNAPERLALRQEHSMPLWTELGEQIAALARELPGRKSSLGKGVSYWNKQRPFLEAFLSDGFVPISNIHVERLIRTTALFRKNSLFVGSIEAGHRYAALMTLMINCMLCRANPYDYLRDVLTRLASGWPASRKPELMPQAWLGAKQGAD